MSRNAEKAQSMLFRFREAQAGALGLAVRSDRRPRIAATCKDLKQCERWRGEILRDISRKVSKIQDNGLSDYQLRDLNDEINKLFREKFHWENQIIALGGANYKRVGTKQDSQGGQSAPGGQRGYKYFGRAKELPGVRELFERTTNDSTDPEVRQRRDIFGGQPPSYYGDEDEVDGDLLAYENEAEAEAWEDALEELRDADVEIDDPAPALPLAQLVNIAQDQTTETAAADSSDVPEGPGGKRKAATKASAAKKAKLDAEAEPAKAADGFLSALSAQNLKPPTLWTAEQMEKFIVGEQKKALLAEYDA